jgi:hypothetical protein
MKVCDKCRKRINEDEDKRYWIGVTLYDPIAGKAEGKDHWDSNEDVIGADICDDCYAKTLSINDLIEMRDKEAT